MGKIKLQTSKNLLIGAHVSIAGGLHLAFERGASIGCKTIQIFTKSNNQWKSKPLTDEEIKLYKAAERKFKIHPVATHDSYLINLCAADNEILKKSRHAFTDELQRCEALGIPYLIFHPGSHVGAGESEGINKIVESLNLAHEQTPGFKVKSVLETTAGQGTAIGYKFEHLRKIIDGVDEPKRMAVCLDTNHIFSAGYDIRTEVEYVKTFKEFDAIIGLKRLVVIHCNDSKKEFGARVDRHEHIGKGAIGKDAFGFIMRDKRLSKIPKILETPKGIDMMDDRMNLKILTDVAQNKLEQ
ncbi:MAG: deoxyribonuclease IV [Bacteroidota bacterium]|nr:deoxyribonuclease IV [Bacteroidota bacterium]